MYNGSAVFTTSDVMVIPPFLCVQLEECVRLSFLMCLSCTFIALYQSSRHFKHYGSLHLLF
jgi:hypothetical protein